MSLLKGDKLKAQPAEEDLVRLTLRQLTIFLALADQGTTQQAAKQLSLSQSAVSAAVLELERLLGLAVFDRVGKRLQLNDHGRALLPRARALVDHALSLENDFGETPLSAIRIGGSLTIGAYLLPKLIAELETSTTQNDVENPLPRRVLPTIEMSVANSELIANKVASFDLDVGLIEGPCHRHDLLVTPWRKDELVLVVSAQHPLAKVKLPVSFTQLADSAWLLREPGSGTRAILESLLVPHIGPLTVRFELNDHHAIKQCAIEGLGVACLSQLMVEDALNDGRLVALKTPLGALTRQFSLLLHRNKHMSDALRQVADHIKAQTDL